MGDYIGAMHEQQISDLRRDRSELEALSRTYQEQRDELRALRDEMLARIAQLEDASHALLDTIGPGVSEHTSLGAAMKELDAVIHGNATPTDRED